jgi:hypothetical protein
MKLLLNDKEIAAFLIELLDVRESCSDIEFTEHNISRSINYIHERQAHHKYRLDKMRDKFKEKLWKCASEDMREWMNKVSQRVYERKRYYYINIHKHIEYFIKQLGEEKILELYKAHTKQNFIKTVGYQIDSDAIMTRRQYFNNVEEDCLMRNTVGNEKLLVNKIDDNHPFWFIDSGYTNFLEPNKKWHRLVKNHLHFNRYFDAPADRMNNFKSFPQPWRLSGEKILVVEPGQFAASIFHADPKTWKSQIESELRKYTDRPIEFRPKTNKKTRESLYDKLCKEDYYCTVSINSNSAVESIWAGIPAITLGQHISNPITVNNLSQVNNLYRGSLGNWLAWLSYCQFTYDELMDGTAIAIIKKYHV